MKRVVSLLAALCLILSVFTIASAASVTITKQPETQTVKAGGTVTFKVKAKGASNSSITWYFTNPETGESVTGKKLSTVVEGVKVKNPNSLSITLKKVPETMHGWTVHCHIGRIGAGIDTDEAMILIAGKPAPEYTPRPAVTPSPDDSSKTGTSGKAGTSSKTGTSGKAGAEADPEPTATPTPEPPKPIVITGSKVELYRMDNKGNIDTKAATELTFEPGQKASFYVKIPEGTEGTVKYVTVGSVRLTPDGPVTGMSVRGWDTSATVKIKIDKGEEEETEAPRREIATPEPVDESQLVTVTCTNCRFTGWNNSYAESGKVPIGSTITVVAVGGMTKKGFTINGEAKQHKNMTSFQMVVEGDTTISMEKLK